MIKFIGDALLIKNEGDGGLSLAGAGVYAMTLIMFIGMLNACSQPEPSVARSLEEIDISGSPNGVVLLPEEVPSAIRDAFVRYTRVVAPNGKPIHMLAQEAWTVDQILKARNVLQHLITDFPGSEYGDNKDAVANSMADRSATMGLFKDPEAMREAFRGLRNIGLNMQDLRANECPWEGSDDYMNHMTRDASYEEIWHLVHDNGIKQALPEMIAEMRLANDAAAEAGWDGYPEDEPQEHPNEYVSVLIDNYLELWAVKPKLYEGREIDPARLPDGHSHFGRYFATTRPKMKEMDPAGYALVEKFFHPYLTYTPVLPEDFEGTFSISFNEDQPYTWKSQHLKDVTLSGENNVNLYGNDMDNVLTGNAGNNQLRGGRGKDVLDGKDGDDTVLMYGIKADYIITEENGKVKIEDKEENRDAVDYLLNVERIQFGDQLLFLNQ